MSSLLCSSKFIVFIFILSAIPIAIFISLELSPSSCHVYFYSSNGWLRESATWDDVHRRFLVSFMEGGVGQIRVSDDGSDDDRHLQEIVAVKDDDVAGNASLGISIDRARNRLLVVHADVIWNRYSAVAAYDLDSWKRLFLTQLSGPGDEKSFADDVAVGPEGNAYVTDAKASKIWKVSPSGQLLSTLRDPLFTQKEWYKSLVSLNGIVYHPDGFLLVIHTFSGNLYKVNILNDEDENEKVKLVKVAGGPLRFGDGLELVSSTKLVVAGNPSARLVESSDGWETASVTKKFWGPMHRLATAATVKDGKVYLSHMFGFGFPKKKHALVEAVF